MGFSAASVSEGFQRGKEKPFGAPAGAYLLSRWKINVPGRPEGVRVAFFIPKLLGGGQFFLIGNVIENQFITVGEWNFGSAISMIMAVVMMLCMFLIRRVDERNSGRGRRRRRA